jgi:hypothetical protein
MSDPSEPLTPAAPAAGGESAPPAGGGESPGGSAEPGSESLTPEDVKALRKDLAAVRKEAAEYRTKLKERDDADLSTAQKLERGKATAEADRDQLATDNRNLRAEIAAAKVGVRTEALEDAVKLLDWDEIDDPTDRKQVEAALKALVKAKPYLSGRPDGLDGGNGRQGGADTGGSMNEIIRRAAGRS